MSSLRQLWSRIHMFEVSRWWTLAFSLLMEIIAGILYVFSIYSNNLKDKLNLSQEQLQTIASMINIGCGMGLPSGITMDAVGPRFTIVVGVILLSVSYCGVYAAVTGIMNQSFETMCIFAFLLGLNNTFCDNCVVVTNAKNFPKQRGVVISLLSSLVGLSCSVNTQLYIAFFDPDWTTFLLFIGLGLSAVVLLSVPFVNETRYSHRTDTFEGWTSRRLFVLEMSIICLAIYLQLISTLEHVYDDMSSVIKIALTVGMLSICSVFFVVPFLWRNQHLVMKDDQHEHGVEMVGDHRDDDSRTETSDLTSTTITPPATESKDEGEDGKTVKQALLDIKFWLIFISILVGSGGGITVFNNIGQMVESLGGVPGSEGAFVSALGIASCLGRLGIGVISSKLEGKLPRPWLYFGAMVLMTLSQFALGFSSLNTLYFGCIGSGMALGCFYAGTPAMVADLFGVKYMGTILGLVMMAPLVGSVTMSRFLASWVYVQHTPAGSTKCYGQDCFGKAFFLNGALCAAGSVLAFILVMLSRSIYLQLWVDSNNSNNNNTNKDNKDNKDNHSETSSIDQSTVVI